jgi:hypothetical protein
MRLNIQKVFAFVPVHVSEEQKVQIGRQTSPIGHVLRLFKRFHVRRVGAAIVERDEHGIVGFEQRELGSHQIVQAFFQQRVALVIRFLVLEQIEHHFQEQADLEYQTKLVLVQHVLVDELQKDLVVVEDLVQVRIDRVYVKLQVEQHAKQYEHTIG